ncbi:MAG: hypothetical protein ACRCWD_01645 [Culicoidibacterales bacterium]
MEVIRTAETQAELSELVTTYFQDKKYRLFREFCFKFQIRTLQEITPEVLEKFSKQLGVGKTKSARIQKIYEEGFPIEAGETIQTLEKPEEAEFPTTISLEQIQDLNVEVSEAFKETHFKMIVNFCRANNIQLVSELDGPILRKIRTLSGMGPKKYRYLFERLEIIHSEFIKMRFEVDRVVYEQVQSQPVTTLIRHFGLNGYESAPEITIADLQGKSAKEVADLGKSTSMIYLQRYLNHPRKTIETALEQLTQEEQQLMNLLHEKLVPIEVISEEFTTTPEEIEQIEKRIYKQLHATFAKYQLPKLLAFLDETTPESTQTYITKYLPEYQTLINATLEN